jgi:hypothetical protein
MTALSDLIDPADRERLLERMRELGELDRLVREPGRNRPPDPPPALADITTERNAP